MVDEEEIEEIYKKGIYAYRKGELNNASDLLMQVVEANEEDHRAWNALGVVLTKAGKYEDADVCFENALVHDQLNEVYERNRKKNRSHIKKSIKDYFSPGSIPLPAGVSMPYLIGGIAAVFILIITLAVVIPPLLYPAPLSATAGDIPISIEQLPDIVEITNTGGPGTELVTEYTVTGNNQTISSPDGTPLTLGTDIGSTLGIPIDELYPVSEENSVTLRLTASFEDGTDRQVALKTLALPVITPEPVIETPPTLAVYEPSFKKGDVLIRTENGVYVLISDLLSDNQYQTEQLSRRNDGLFFVQPGTRQNVSVKEIEESATKSTEFSIPTDGQFRQDTPYQAMRSLSLPVAGVNPFYVPGDVLSRSAGSTDDVIVIMGYDPVADEYVSDTIYQYYSGEWGYRPDDQPEWNPRTAIEGSYPARKARIALSQIGIGADSSPPGTQPLYGEGDIIAVDRGADANLLLVLAWHPDVNQYETDVISQSYDGGWHRNGTNKSVIRSQLEREYPYKVRNVDTSLVHIR